VTLKLLDWNVYCENGNTRAVTEFISAQNADIVCLQEVSEELLARLSRLPTHALATALDEYRVKNGKHIPSYLVIMTNLTVTEVRAVKFKRQPKRSLLALFARWLRIEECLEYQYADVLFMRGTVLKKPVPIRIFNTHLESIAGPKHRIARFTQVLRSFAAGKRNIVCGDLNVLRAWYSFLWRLFLKFLQGELVTWEELWIKEYKVFEKMFEKAHLFNVFNGATTHEWSGNQLDYILVPQGTEIARKTLFEETHGSDHKPMLVEFRL